MDIPDTDSGDAVIHTTQRLIINGVGYEAAFTEKQIILAETDSGTNRVTIPYSAITHAATETNKLREPVLRITYGTPDGSSRGIELIFIFLAAGRNIRNRDRCVTVLEKHGIGVQPDPNPSDYYSRAKRERMDAGTLEEEKAAGRPAVPEWTVYGPAQGTRQATADEPKPVSPAITIAAIIILAAILIAAMVTPLPEPARPSWLKIDSAPAATPSATPVPEPGPEPVQAYETPAPEETLVPGAVPGNGVWIKIAYPGSYTGFLAAGGLRTEVNSSGTGLYQMPVHDTTIDIFVEKEDGTGEMLDIGVYNGGEFVSGDSTATPRGALEMHVPVGPAVVRSTGAPASPPAVAPTPTTEAVPGSSPVPTNGVFVRAVYPGQYTGTISANGFERAVNTSGEQVFQLSMNRGSVDAFLEKGDGSVRNLLVQVYRNGELVTAADTSTPLGVVEIHTVI